MHYWGNRLVSVQGGRSTSIHPSNHPTIHPSFLPPLCRSSPPTHTHSITSTKTQNAETTHGGGPCDFGILDSEKNLHHSKLEKRIRNLVVQRWTVPFYISARSSDVTLEAAEKDRPWRHCIEISMERRIICIGARNAPVPSVYHDVIDIIFGFRLEITAAPHL